MNLADATRVVAFATGYDARITATPERAYAWQESIRGDLDVADAVEAIKAHYAHSGEAVRPDHINHLGRSKAEAVGYADVLDPEGFAALTPAEQRRCEQLASDLRVESRNGVVKWQAQPSDRRILLALAIETSERAAIGPGVPLSGTESARQQPNWPNPHSGEGPPPNPSQIDAQEVSA